MSDLHFGRLLAGSIGFSSKFTQFIRENVIIPERIEKVKQLQHVAEELGCSMAQLGLAWCLKNPDVSTVITGASRPEQVVENMKAVEVAPRLTSEVIERMEQVLRNKPQQDED